MKVREYGQLRVADDPLDWLSQAVEEIDVLGYTILSDVLDSAQLAEIRTRINAIYRRQSEQFGEERLQEIGDQGTARALLLHDEYFAELAVQPRIVQLVETLLGKYFILSLQNAILNNERTHPQVAWHRDLPYQTWVPDKPVAINALFAIDDFRIETGGTRVLPFSHRLAQLPSWDFFARHAVTAEAPAGSVIVFNSWLVHCAGQNTSGLDRRAINQLYTTPIIKQQYDFPRALNGKWADDPRLAYLLGYGSQVPLDDQDWRNRRLGKLGNTQ